MAYDSIVTDKFSLGRKAFYEDRGAVFKCNYKAGIPTSTILLSSVCEAITSKTGTSEQDIIDGIHYDTAPELSAILDMCCVLNCENVYTEDKTNRKINKKRIKAGKKPFYTYKVLRVGDDKISTKHDGGVKGHRSPRIHIRRGHIRRLQDRAVWVNACVVGNKKNGIVVKDYKL